MSAIFMIQLYMTLSVTKIMARVMCAILMLCNHVILMLMLLRYIFDTPYSSVIQYSAHMPRNYLRRERGFLLVPYFHLITICPKLL